ncbi:SDR family NAD(P)-dependent oxidoreductase [Sporichthya polymorpha]|uniref:SDR family NAD(P)-dependent oxidoreductase n=1 Tax=Sporichthya polymorpha TaxID=35751 RepID=UPI00036331B0|nr:SDR family NAD(P)-dependent oxidoreductase [Sporichthya polymorpha]
MIDLKGEIAVVTGGASGIGRGVVELLVQCGAVVAIVDRDAEAMAVTLEGLGSAPEVAAFVTDVTVLDEVHEMRRQVLTDLGTPTILVNSVGWDRPMPFAETDPAFWKEVLDLNLLSTLTVTHEFFGPMLEQARGGRIVNIASEAGRIGSLHEALYSSAKGAVIALTKALAREGARHAVTVNCVCPGVIDTPLYRSMPDPHAASRVRAIPMRRLGIPEDVAAAVVFLASPGAAYITGQVLSVSGGLTMVG